MILEECHQALSQLLAGRLEGLASLTGHVAKLLAEAPPGRFPVDDAARGLVLAADLERVLKPLEDALGNRPLPSNTNA